MFIGDNMIRLVIRSATPWELVNAVTWSLVCRFLLYNNSRLLTNINSSFRIYDESQDPAPGYSVVNISITRDDNGIFLSLYSIFLIKVTVNVGFGLLFAKSNPKS